MKELRDLKDLTIHDVQLGRGWCKPTQRATKGYTVAAPPKIRDLIRRIPHMSLRYCLPSSSLLRSSLELSDTQVYEPYIRALLGTASLFCEVVVFILPTVGPVDYSRMGYSRDFLRDEVRCVAYRGTSLIRNSPPPRTTIGP